MLEYLLLAAVEQPVTFMTFNVCKSSGCGNSPSWDTREHRINNVLGESNADVVAIQEATDWRVHGRMTQWEDISANHSSHYASPTTTINTCDLADCDHSARILFNSDTIQQAGAAGSVLLGDIVDGLSNSSARRQVSWAYLQKNGRVFLVVSLHTDNAKTTIGEQDRILIGQGIADWVVQNNALYQLDVPVILMGDFNSYAARQPQGIQFHLTQNGWVDSYTASDKTNVHYSTVNYTPDTSQWEGWPLKPRYFSNPATRIDYIFGFNGVRWERYEVLIKRLPNGDFDPRYQASDHQPVMATALLTPQ